MRTIGRLLGVIGTVAGLVGTLLCFAGVVGCWLLYAEASRRYDRVFDRAAGTLERIHADVSLAGARLDQTGKDLAELRDREVDPTRGPARGVRQAMTRKAVQSAGLDLGQAHRQVTRATEAALVLTGVLQALADLAVTDELGIDVEQLRANSDRLSHLTSQSEGLGRMLAAADPAGGVAEQTTALCTGVDQVVAGLRQASERVERTRDQIEDWRVRMRRWLTLAAGTITGVLVWVGAGQVSLLVHGRRMSRAG